MQPPLLTPSQQRSLHSSLFLFEKALRAVDHMISESDNIGILYYRTSRLDDKSRMFIHKKIESTLEELDHLTKKLGLKPLEESLENSIMAEMSICWESLEESRSKRMRGYGELTPESIKIIDPVIDHFAKVALELSRMVTSKSHEEFPDDPFV